MPDDSRRRHYRRRPQRAGHRFLSGQGRIQAAGAGTPLANWRSGHHRRISSRLPLFYAGALGRAAAAGNRPRHATGATRAEADHAGSCGDRAFARWPRTDPLQRCEDAQRRRSRSFRRKTRRISRVPAVAGKNWPRNWRCAEAHAAQH